MPLTKQDVIDDFGRSWYQSAGEAAESLFDDAHREIVSTLPVRSGYTDIPLVAGTSVYALPSNVFRVDEAWYVPSADLTAWRTLTPYDFAQEHWDGQTWDYGSTNATPTQGWRVVPASATPGGSQAIEFGPTTNLTTVGGYPVVRLYGAIHQDLIPTDTLPDGILGKRLYLTHMAQAWAERQDPDRYAYRLQLWQQAKTENMKHLKDRMPNTPANRLVPSTARRQTRRI